MEEIWLKLIKLLLGVCLLTTLIACQQPTDKEIYYRAQKKMAELESYSCYAKIFVQGTDGEEKQYLFRQDFKAPNKYRIEVISPENLKGNLTISNGEAAWILHPGINQVWKMKSFEKSKEQMLFIGYFLQNLFSTESASVTSEQLEGVRYIIIEAPIPGGSQYFDRQRLWIDTGNLEPYKLYIVDKEGVTRFRVLYEAFKYNPKLSDDLFYPMAYISEAPTTSSGR